MKVEIGSFGHETSSFSNEKTDLNLFKTFTFDEPEEIIEKHKGMPCTIGSLGGFIDYALEKDWEIVPLIAAACLPTGPIEHDAYEYIKDKMVNGIEDDVDGVLLHLHGAAVVDGLDDAEGDMLTAVREKVGPNTPVIVELDLHANVSKLMFEKATAIYGYDEQPHTDVRERQIEGAQLFEAIMIDGVKPVAAWAQPPMLLPAILTETKSGPMQKTRQKACEWEKKDGVINVATFAGFYGSDKYSAGASIVVTTDNDKDLAVQIARDMADYMWSIKEEFYFEMAPIDESIEKAKAEGGFWAFIDECDDPLGGGTADGTFILQKMIEHEVASGGVSTINDPEIIQEAISAGVGGTVTGLLGAKKDRLHGEPIKLNATVEKITNETIPWAYWDEENRQDVGTIAVLNQKGIKIVVTELKAGTENIDIFGILGYDVNDLNIVVMKGLGQAIRDVFKEKPRDYITPESIGITNPDVTKIGDFKKLRRPIYPFDKNVAMRYE